MRNNIKPINVVHVQETPQFLVDAVMEAISVLLEIAGVRHLIKVNNFGAWRQSGKWLDANGGLVPFQSVDWYVQIARKGGDMAGQPGRQNADVLLQCFADHDPYQRIIGPHMSVMITNDKLCSNPQGGIVAAIGIAEPGIVGIVTTSYLTEIDSSWEFRRECMKTLAMHEFGHMFGAAVSRGIHCDNHCIMQSAQYPVRDMIAMTVVRLKGEIGFCSECRNDIISFFA